MRDGEECSLIPRYFDLLLLLVERQGEAVSRREIFDTVWSDVVVTDNALNQAVRILRRTLADDSRTPTFIRTVSRHGYRFVYPDLTEQSDAEPLDSTQAGKIAPTPSTAAGEPNPYDRLIETLLRGRSQDSGQVDRRREAAERLHALGTAEALRRLDRKPGHHRARALLRETRWDVPGAAPVPILGQPAPLRTTLALAGLRLRMALRLAGQRWAAAAGGGAAAGVLAGILGAMVLRFGPGADSNHALFVALPLTGALAGGLGATGVGAGLAAAEAIVRSFRGLALVVMGAAGGCVIAAITNLMVRLTMEGVFGRGISPLAGAFEGLVIGAACGLGYALSTPTRDGGMATPRGRARWRTLLTTGLTCAAATALLGGTGSYLGAMSLDFLARTYPGSQVALAPLARLLGESHPGVLTRTLISAWEGLFFGAGLAMGMTRRPR